jgi:hypothetical protein
MSNNVMLNIIRNILYPSYYIHIYKIKTMHLCLKKCGIYKITILNYLSSIKNKKQTFRLREN